MKVKLIPSEEFLRRLKHLAKKYKSMGDDYRTLKESLMENPFQGDNLGQGVHKVCMSIASKGKGGGARVLTLIMLVSDDTEVTLLTIYNKGEISNVSDNYIQALIRNL